MAIHPRLAERAREPRYSIPTAGLIVRRPPSTVRRWVMGNTRQYRGTRRRDPALIRPDGPTDSQQPLSFLNLLELRFLASYRNEVPLQSIRRALDWTSEALDQERPLLTAEFKVRGRSLFLQFASEGEDPYLVSASDGGQLAWPDAVDEFMEAVDYDNAEQAAFRWWPLGRHLPIVIETTMNAGLPSTADSAVRTVAIAAFHREGLSPESIADDVGASLPEVSAALDFEQVAA